MPTLIHPVETVPVNSLIPHPNNYRVHSKKQLKHICDSISQHGLYRNVVIANDSTILAGHGVVQAVKILGVTDIQVIRLDVSHDSVIALKVLTGDNEISNLVDADDKALLGILRDIASGDNLLGTGFDEDLLSGLAQESSPREFAEDAWEGMPEYTQDDIMPHRQIIVSFNSDESVAKFAKLTNALITPKTRSFWFPPEEVMSTVDHAYTSDDDE